MGWDCVGQEGMGWGPAKGRLQIELKDDDKAGGRQRKARDKKNSISQHQDLAARG